MKVTIDSVVANAWQEALDKRQEAFRNLRKADEESFALLSIISKQVWGVGPGDIVLFKRRDGIKWERALVVGNHPDYGWKIGMNAEQFRHKPWLILRLEKKNGEFSSMEMIGYPEQWKLIEPIKSEAAEGGNQ